MSNDTFLLIDGIEGNVTEEGLRGAVRVLFFAPPARHRDPGSGRIESFGHHLMLPMSRVAAKLERALLDNRTLPRMQVIYSRIDGTEEPYRRRQVFHNLTLCGCHPQHGGDNDALSFKFTAEKEETFTEFLDDAGEIKHREAVGLDCKAGASLSDPQRC